MQQINLYLPEFQPNREPLRSVHMLLGLPLFILLLGLFSWFSSVQNRDLAQTLEQQNVQLAQLKAQVKQLELQKPPENLADLDTKILRLRDERTLRERILSIIANKKLGNNSGFSAYLQAMGRQSLDTLSLQVFSLSAGGSYAEFAGSAQAADQIPLYLQRLRTEPAFAQSAFGVLEIAPVKNNRGMFDFVLAKESTTVEPQAKTAMQLLVELNKQTRGEN
jgi:hypothetical protein